MSLLESLRARGVVGQTLAAVVVLRSLTVMRFGVCVCIVSVS